MSSTRPVISFLASHGGTAVRHVLAAMASGELSASCGIVVTNNRDSAIYAWCLEQGVDVIQISAKTHPGEAAEDLAITAALVSAGTDIIVLSGYMKKIGCNTLAQYSGKILNIHPSLLPAHGGKGLYGDRVHRSVLQSGDKKSGATVHYINEEYDEGPIIMQQAVSVGAADTVASLKAKVQNIEGPLYVQAIQKII
ncbi:phosphoribosylglycinamide formyltransferase [Gammaproteobacteria bacterium 53_120_T64]|nr:phosphoribosylglycinamide formyltransferase [Gammaproteobacteria bacterium 53_120_T64]